MIYEPAKAKGNSALVVIESPGPVLPGLDWSRLFAVLDGTDRVTLLSFTDAPIDAPLAILAERVDTVRVVEAAALLQEEAAGFPKELEAWLGDLKTRFGDMPDWWLVRFTELNLGAFVWFDLLRLSVVEREMRQVGYQRCICIGGSAITTTVGCLAQAKGLAYSSTQLGKGGYGWVKMGGLAAAKWLHNFVADVWTWALTRKRERRGKYELLIFTSFPNNWFLEDDRGAYSRYTGRIAECFNEAGEADGAYLCTLPRHNRAVLKSPREILRARRLADDIAADMPIVVVESFGDLAALLSSYFRFKGWCRWFYAWRSLLSAGDVTWRGVDVSLLFRDAALAGPLIDWPTARYLETCVARAIKSVKASSLLVPIFELVEGRAAVRAGNHAGLTTVGIQHGVHGLAHHWRFAVAPGAILSEAGVAADPLPKVFAVESEPDAELLAAYGIPPARTRVVGAPRVDVDVPDFQAEKEFTSTVLLMGDLPGPRRASSPWWLNWCLENLASRFRLVVRSHPSVIEETSKVLEWWSRNPAVRATLGQGGTLQEELARERPLAVLASVTGATIEVALTGWPVGIIRSNWILDCSPLTSMPDNGIFSSGHPGEVCVWLERLLEDLDYRSSYIKKCYDLARNLIETTGFEAAKRVVSCLK